MTEELLTRGVAEVIDRKHLEESLRSGKKLRVKLGIDPTGAKLHLGHAVVLIIGDTTAAIGDPSGKNETRPQMSAEEIEKNYATFEKQALKILDKKLLEVHRQSEWFGKFGLIDVINEASKLSAGWITSHETFRRRLAEGQTLAFHELLYPLVQAYDSVAIKADVELGGMDQKFNLLTGRELMRAHQMSPQDIVLSKYLIGTDGQKMGKSLGNFIAIEEEPNEMFAKAMTIDDSLILEYFELATNVSMDEIQVIAKELKAGTNPRDIKIRLSIQLVTEYHDEKAAEVAAAEWQKDFSQKEKPSEIEEVKVKSKNIVDVLVETELASSKSEAKRLIEQSGVKVDDQIANEETEISSGNLLQVGKRKFIRIK